MFSCRFECNLDKAITTSSSVSLNDIDSMEFLLEIDVNPNFWFLSGPTRMRFQIPWTNDRPCYETNISVIPIRTGLIPLPNLSVTCLSDKSCQTVCNSNGQQVLIHQSTHVARTFYLQKYFNTTMKQTPLVLTDNLTSHITRQMISSLPAVKLEDDGRSLHYSK
jgi:hypothetical protein